MNRVCVYRYNKFCVKRPFSKRPKIGFQRERADLLALVGDVFCIFVTFPIGINILLVSSNRAEYLSSRY